MPDAPREVWITGIGIVSSLGEGPDAHWQGLDAGRVVVETEKFGPCVVHPMAPLDFDRQIPKKGDQRQMEAWQRIGTYAAGLALDEAGVKGDAEVLARMDLVVAASGGERDIAVDAALIRALPAAERPGAMLNERLMSDLRPTLFLAQLSNLLAGNISIVHGVTGSSRTFMGEEQAGVDAVRVALARIAAGQSDIALVGGACNSERPELLLFYDFARFNLRPPLVPVWARADNPGLTSGAMGAFLVIEAKEHAEARGAAPLARLAAVEAEWNRREPGSVAASLGRLYGRLSARLGNAPPAVISGASGIAPATGEERQFLAERPDLAVRAPASHLGHGTEAQFPMNVALAALALRRGRLFRSHDPTGVEQAPAPELRQILVTSTGMWRGEGMALIEAVEGGSAA